MNDLNSRRILDPALAEHLALIEDTDEIADTVAELLGLLILRPDDYVPKKVVSYVYLWINFTRLRSGAVPFLYIGSRRNSGDPLGDDYQGSNVGLNRDQAAGDDCRKYILAVFEVDDGDAYELEAVILHDLDVMASVEFYNRSNSADGFDSETAKAMNKTIWANPDHRVKMSKISKALMSKQWSDPDYKAKMSEKTKAQWRDPEFKARMLEKLKVRSRAQWRDPDYKAHISEKRKEMWADPDFRTNISEKMKECWQDPNYRTKVSGKIKEQWQDPKIAAARSQRSKSNPQMTAHISYYDEWSRRAELHDFEHCDGCGKEIAVEPIREAGKITCFFCENLLQGA